MPGGDGTGPIGQGTGTGQGRGQRRGQGRMGMGRPNATPGGNCVCSKCGTVVVHQRRQPCTMTKCPKCSAPMTRQ